MEYNEVMSNYSTKGFEDIYKENYIKVFTFIYNIANDRSLTEDIVQEAFIKAYYKIDTFRQEAKISVWLNKIAYNLLLDIKRKKSLKIVHSENEQFASNLRDTGKNLLKEVEQKIMSDCVQNKILLMPENYRAPLFLDMQDFNNKEIAEILSCSLDNAKIRLFRAKKKMKEILGNDCSFYYDDRNVLC